MYRNIHITSLLRIYMGDVIKIPTPRLQHLVICMYMCVGFLKICNILLLNTRLISDELSKIPEE